MIHAFTSLQIFFINRTNIFQAITRWRAGRRARTWSACLRATGRWTGPSLAPGSPASTAGSASASGPPPGCCTARWPPSAATSPRNSDDSAN